MQRFVSSALTLSLFALPVAAQDGGQANRKTPTVTQSIAFSSGSTVKLEYRAITWAQGKFMEGLKTPAGRERTNKDMEAKPTGSLTTSQEVTLGGKPVKPGTYKLFFEVEDDKNFHLVLADDAGTKTKWKLPLTDQKNVNTRLALTLTAGKGDNDANVGIAFGTMACTVDMMGAGGKAKDATAPKTGDEAHKEGAKKEEGKKGEQPETKKV